MSWELFEAAARLAEGQAKKKAETRGVWRIDTTPEAKEPTWLAGVDGRPLELGGYGHPIDTCALLIDISFARPAWMVKFIPDAKPVVTDARAVQQAIEASETSLAEASRSLRELEGTLLERASDALQGVPDIRMIGWWIQSTDGILRALRDPDLLRRLLVPQ